MSAAYSRWGAWDLLPCGLLELDDAGRILGLNTALASWLGLEGTESLQGEPVGRVLSRAASLMYHSYVYPEVRLGRIVEEATVVLKHQQGQRLDALMTVRRDCLDGQPVVLCTFQRFQSRKRLEDQLLMAKRAADEAPGMLFQLSQPRQGPMVFSYASQSVAAMLGVQPEQVLQDAGGVWLAVHPQDLPDLLSSLADAGAQGLPWRREFRVGMDGSEAWRELHATPWRDANGDLLWHGYLADITERKQLEASLRDKAAAERANQAKSAFLSRMSHELRTPLNGILGFAQLMGLHDADNLREDQRHKLEYIQMAGHSLLRLINEVLDISRIETGHLRTDIADVPLDTVLATALTLAAPLAQARRVQLLRDGVSGLVVRVDMGRLEQALLNVLSNAIKYGPEAGRVQVSVAVQGGRAQVRVHDEGPGLSEAQRQHLFEPFNRLGAERGRTEGVGLGLVISRGLLQHMGGDLVLVASHGGPGACFELTLPISATSP